MSEYWRPEYWKNGYIDQLHPETNSEIQEEEEQQKCRRLQKSFCRKYMKDALNEDENNQRLCDEKEQPKWSQKEIIWKLKQHDKYFSMVGIPVQSLGYGQNLEINSRKLKLSVRNPSSE